MTGAPKTGVTALMGMMPLSPGRILMIEHNSAMAEPHKAVAGSNTLWLDVPNRRRDICGTASPMNDIGPQNAVVTAVSMPVESKSMFRVCLMFTPRFSAYLVPSSSAFIGFISDVEIASPIMTIMANAGICDIDTPPKFPIPHVT